MSYVYFIQSGDDGLIKIGYSKNPERRMAKLQTGSAAILRLIATQRGEPWLESYYHERFADCRIHGEHFEPTEELGELIKELDGDWSASQAEDEDDWITQRVLAAYDCDPAWGRAVAYRLRRAAL